MPNIDGLLLSDGKKVTPSSVVQLPAIGSSKQLNHSYIKEAMKISERKRKIKLILNLVKLRKYMNDSDKNYLHRAIIAFSGQCKS